MLLLQEFAEHRHSSTSALLHTFNGDVCALMAKDAASSAMLPAECAAVHGASNACASQQSSWLCTLSHFFQRLPSTRQCFC